MTDLAPIETPGEAREKREVDDFIDAIADGIPEMHAALMVGWSRAKLKRLLRDHEFAERLQVAMDLRDEVIEEVVYRKAKAGDKDLIKYYLNNRRPRQWADRRQVDVSGELSAPINVKVAVVAGLKELLSAERTSLAELQPGGILDAEVIEDSFDADE
jgi:hypothetical protein